uniref:Uncharacterized protein n=1 Tax=Triticum urartu TaxID=4572 RepID=A0A8R7TK98_TRIUA
MYSVLKEHLCMPLKGTRRPCLWRRLCPWELFWNAPIAKPCGHCTRPRSRMARVRTRPCPRLKHRRMRVAKSSCSRRSGLPLTI